VGGVRGTGGHRSGTTPEAFQTATRARECSSLPRSLVTALVGVVLLGIGIVLLANSFLGVGRGDAATSGQGSPGRQDKTLELTIPKLVRIRHDTVPDASAADEGALRRSAAIHLRGTGFPWQRGANVYLAGHRLGYPRTESFLAFWDLDELEEGDEVLISDATGAKYTYRVFNKFVVSPEASWVTKPVPSKNILTLQTCTLPDYKDRLIVRAELVGKRGADEGHRLR
jgi:sortase A